MRVCTVHLYLHGLYMYVYRNSIHMYVYILYYYKII